MGLILISGNMASRPEQAEEKVKALENDVSRLTGEIDGLTSITIPRLITREETCVLSDGAWIYRRVIESSSRFVPNGVFFAVRAENITRTNFRALNNVVHKAGLMAKTPRLYQIYVQQPFGAYEVVVQFSGSPEIEFEWKFDDYPGETDFTRCPSAP
ncbi:MAG: hypothetical protein ACTSX7_14955 [Alphaproteobacteria bacterium]